MLGISHLISVFAYRGAVNHTRKPNNVIYSGGLESRLSVQLLEELEPEVSHVGSRPQNSWILRLR